MNPVTINTTINKLCAELIKCNFGIDYNASIYNDNEKVIKMNSNAKLYEIISIPNLVERYKKFLEQRYFNCVLFDGALIQFHYKFNRQNEIIKHRLCYIPCPLEILSDEIDEYSIIELIDLIKEDNEEFSNRIQNTSPIRFDFDIENCSNSHPASHLTLISDNCRIPVCSPFSPRGFVRFILEHFYNLENLEKKEINTNIIKQISTQDYELFSKIITNEHKKLLHLNCDVC